MEEDKEKMKTYNLGLIGAGNWAKNYYNTVSNMENIEIVAVARRKNERPDFISKECRFYSDWQKLYREEKLDGIIVATDYNFPFTHDILFYGRPVLSEKPAITDFLQIESLNISAKNHKLLVNYIHLFSPAFQKIKELTKNKKIVRIYSTGYNAGPKREHFSSLFDYGTHDLSLILDLIYEEPKETYIVNKNATKSGELFTINLTFNDATSQSIVGNGALIKSRTISVFYEDDGKNVSCLMYDDVAKLLTLNGKSIDFDNSISPLTHTINNFIRLINGEKDYRFVVDLTTKITKILLTYTD